MYIVIGMFILVTRMNTMDKIIVIFEESLEIKHKTLCVSRFLSPFTEHSKHPNQPKPNMLCISQDNTQQKQHISLYC